MGPVALAFGDLDGREFAPREKAWVGLEGNWILAALNMR